MGKTQLAAGLARQFADRGRVDLLVWVNAGPGAEAIVAGYAEAATVLGLAEEGGGGAAGGSAVPGLG